MIDLKAQKQALLLKVKQYNIKADSKKIEQAMDFAYEAHKGQKRASGEEYIIHCFEVAEMIIELRMGDKAIIAAVLHDIIEDTQIKPEQIQKLFGKEVLDIIQSLTKLRHINEKLSLDTAPNQNQIDKSFDQKQKERQEARAENIRKIVLATAKDIRVIIIKLVDRLHNMRTLKYLHEDRQKIIAKETLEIYAPIAHKLGMEVIKAELEDLSFHCLEPKIYAELKRKIAIKKEEREQELKKIQAEIKNALKKEHIEAEVYGRTKHFYSIYKKLQRDQKEFSEIYDLTAIRIITKNMHDCYSALGVVHTLWKPIPKRFKDYIAMPKPNGYQSLHTDVIGSHGKILEVQIRTKEMHQTAEQGIASHWRYKGDSADTKFDRQVEWLKQILDWNIKSEEATDFLESLKVDFFEKEIFVFTPRGDTISLPEQSTPVDFAYSVHTDIGNHCKAAKVNGTIVPLDYKLNPGDIIEIITAKNMVPSRNWLSFTKSAHATLKIKQALNIAGDSRERSIPIKQTAPRPGFEVIDGAFFYNGKKVNIKMPKCCYPKINDPIRAFKNKEGEIIIHKKNCLNLYTYKPEQEITLKKESTHEETHKLRIEVQDRVGLLADILNVLSQANCSIKDLKTKFGKKDNAIITVVILKQTTTDIQVIIKKIEKIKAVKGVFLEE